MPQPATSGKRRTRVTFQRLKSGLTQDAAGHINNKTETNWETYCKRWARVEYGGGSETIVGDKLLSTTNWLLTLPNDAESRSILTTMRAKFDGVTCGISERPYDADKGRREIAIRCFEVA